MSGKTISMLVLSLVFQTTATLAQNPGDGDVFKRFDKNGDGRLTAAELPSPQLLQRFDKNRDGVVTRDELAGGGNAEPGKAGEQMERLLKAADKNSDGRVTKAEAGNAPWFARLDQNQDGVIDAGELAKIREGMAKGDSGKGVAGMGKGQAARGGPDALIARADTDGDGRITKAEAGDAQWFDKVDKNGDGVLDAGELNVLRDALEKNGAGR